MKPQHLDLMNEFNQKHVSWNSKLTKIVSGNILLVCPPEMFDSLGRFLLTERSSWKSSVREDTGGEEFYAYEPYTPFSKYATLKKQTGDLCTKVPIIRSRYVRDINVNGKCDKRR